MGNAGLIVLAGGVFIMYTVMKEIIHMLAVEGIDHSDDKDRRSVAVALVWIMSMNLMFSFDSILSTMVLSDRALQ